MLSCALRIRKARLRGGVQWVGVITDLVFVAGGTSRMGSEALPGRGAGSPRCRWRLLDRPYAGNQSAVPEIRQRNRPRHVRGDTARREGLSGRASANAESGLPGFHLAETSGRSARLVAMVDVQGRRQLAPALRTAQLDQWPRRSSGRPHRLPRCGGLREMGGQGIADRSRMGVCRARWARRRRVRLGRHFHTRRATPRQYVAGRLSTRIAATTAFPDFPGRGVSAERLWHLRHDRQYLGVDRRLVRGKA